MTNLPLKQSAVRFVEGDLEALSQLFPATPPTVKVRELIHTFVRDQIAKGKLSPQKSTQPQPEAPL